MCACAERRAALVAVAAAVMRGSAADLKTELRFVAVSAAIDAKTLATRSLSAARARLAR